MSLELPNVAATESFPPEPCPTYGYFLKGLPPCGVCPECGVGYDNSQFILYGKACGQHATASNARGWRLIFVFTPLAFSGQILDPTISNAWRAAFIVSWLLILIPSIMRRKSTYHPGGIQLRFNSKGIVQLNDLAQLRRKLFIATKGFETWGNLKMAIWKQTSEDRLRLRMAFRDNWFGLDTYPIDAELECTREEAGKLRRQIRAWRKL
jgi:hypothetical protein